GSQGEVEGGEGGWGVGGGLGGSIVWPGIFSPDHLAGPEWLDLAWRRRRIALRGAALRGWRHLSTAVGSVYRQSDGAPGPAYERAPRPHRIPRGARAPGSRVFPWRGHVDGVGRGRGLFQFLAFALFKRRPDRAAGGEGLPRAGIVPPFPSARRGCAGPPNVEEHSHARPSRNRNLSSSKQSALVLILFSFDSHFFCWS